MTLPAPGKAPDFCPGEPGAGTRGDVVAITRADRPGLDLKFKAVRLSGEFWRDQSRPGACTLD